MSIWLWVGFVLAVGVMLLLDLRLLHKKAHVISLGEASVWTAFWIILALAFNVGIYYLYENHVLGIGLHTGHDMDGRTAAWTFLAGYVIEKSLSLDNIFVMALLFSFFHVPPAYQHKALFWGVFGALLMRGAMIVAGTALIRQFNWINYVFGGLLLLTAIKMLVVRSENVDPDRNWFVRLARKLYPVTPDYQDGRIFTRLNGRRAVTPLFLVLAAVESTDLLFAIDSIPAIFAITTDPFIVYTSNVFAIMGLRSLYFVLAGAMNKFRYMKASLAFLLAFIGSKMLVAHHYPIPVEVSLVVIAGILSVGLAASIWASRREPSAPIPIVDALGILTGLAWDHTRRAMILLMGATLILVGLAMLVLPGPGFLVLIGGLALLATEFVWASALLRRMKRTATAWGDKLKATVQGSASTKPPDPPD